MQTPQGFRRGWLEEAHRRAVAEGDTPATDDVGLVQRAGREVRCVRGDRRNFKITTPGDWQMAQQLWAAWTDDPDRTGAAAE
jgi:2-C-methyl-D-erythritol 4-phosphate cytidylyltransferase